MIDKTFESLESAVAGIHLMVTSNHDSPQLRAGCLQLGANGYFDKVKELSELAGRIRALADELAASNEPEQGSR